MNAERCDLCGHVRASGEKFTRGHAQLTDLITPKQGRVPLYEPLELSFTLCLPCADVHFDKEPDDEWF